MTEETKVTAPDQTTPIAPTEPATTPEVVAGTEPKPETPAEAN